MEIPQGHDQVFLEPVEYEDHNDIHAETAALIYGVDIDDVTKAMRAAGKHYNMNVFRTIAEWQREQD